MWKNLSDLHRPLTSTPPSNIFGMNWNTGCEPDLIAQHQCWELINALVAEREQYCVIILAQTTFFLFLMWKSGKVWALQAKALQCYICYIYIYIAICVSPQNKSCPQTYRPIPWKIKRGGKNPKVNPKVKRFTLVSGGGCIDFTLKAPGWAWHYQSNSLIWTSKTSSAIGFLPFSIPLSGIYEQQLSARCTLA